jgi:N6-adenosine-specific RNA methylase IME4
LARAASEGLSTRETKALAKQEKNRVGAKCDTCTTDDLAQLIARGDKFGSIYADPPWVYDNQTTRAATGNHYGGLTVDELCALPVRELAADDAHLHLWTTNAFLFDCARIFDAWGFEFRSTFVWVKPQMCIGNYWRNSHEFLLTGIRGDAKRFNDHSLKSWLECDRSRHSEKPFVVRDFIRRASPGPYLEMFARTPADGWTCWGNEIERGLLFPHAEAV